MTYQQQLRFALRDRHLAVACAAATCFDDHRQLWKAPPGPHAIKSHDRRFASADARGRPPPPVRVAKTPASRAGREALSADDDRASRPAPSKD